MAAIINTGNVESMKRVNFQDVYQIKTVPMVSVAICRKNSASVNDKMSCICVTSDEMRLVSSPTRRCSKNEMGNVIILP